MISDHSLTQKLREKRPLKAPPSWRDDILRKALSEADTSPKPVSASMLMKKWRPRLAMAAVWMVIAVSHFIGKREDTKLAEHLAPAALPCPMPLTGPQIEMLVAWYLEKRPSKPAEDPHYPQTDPFETHGPI